MTIRSPVLQSSKTNRVISRPLEGSTESLPVHNVQGVEVAQCTGNFSGIEPGSGLQEDPLSLEVVEQLRRKYKRASA